VSALDCAIGLAIERLIARLGSLGLAAGLGPDQILEDAPRLWPDTTTFPFHYRHPVTGKEVTSDPAA
jgi:hypothetical protein